MCILAKLFKNELEEAVCQTVNSMEQELEGLPSERFIKTDLNTLNTGSLHPCTNNCSFNFTLL